MASFTGRFRGAGARRRGPARLRALASALLLVLATWGFVAGAEGSPRLVSAVSSFQLMPSLSRLVAAPAVPAFLAAFAILALTLVFGRWYCSFFCPLGALQDACAALGHGLRRLARRLRRSRGQGRGRGRGREPGKLSGGYRPGRPGVHAAALGFALAAAVAGASLVYGFLEPFSAFGKVASGIARPAVALLSNAGAALARAVGSREAAYAPLGLELPTAIAGGLVLLLAGGLALARGRLFCDLLCPAGALLRLASRRPLFGLVVDGARCDACGACARACRASCIGDGGGRVDEDRCVRCLDCLGACPRGAITLGRKGRTRRPGRAVTASPDGTGTPAGGSPMGRRAFLALASGSLLLGAGALAGAAGGVAAGRLARGARRPRAFFAGRSREPAAPPGAKRVGDFLDRCTACGACAAACPSGVIKPSTFEWGLLDAAKPFLAYDRAYCQFECRACVQACPSGALAPLALADKKRTRVARSVLDLPLCIVVAKGSRCGACAEHCPTGALAMLQPPGGGLPRPVLDEAYCIGCGACETVCPSLPLRAIHVEGRAVQDGALVLEGRQGASVREGGPEEAREGEGSVSGDGFPF